MIFPQIKLGKNVLLSSQAAVSLSQVVGAIESRLYVSVRPFKVFSVSWLGSLTAIILDNNIKING